MTIDIPKAKASDEKKLNGKGKAKEQPDATKTDKKKAKDEPELSEEDLQLKSDLELLVERLKEPQHELYQASIDQLGTFIRTSTSSMTAVPKPYVAKMRMLTID